MCVSVAMVTRFTKQQNNRQSHIGPRNLCTKMSFIGPQIAELLDMIHDPRSTDPVILPTRPKQNNKKPNTGSKQTSGIFVGYWENLSEMKAADKKNRKSGVKCECMDEVVSVESIKDTEKTLHQRHCGLHTMINFVTN